MFFITLNMLTVSRILNNTDYSIVLNQPFGETTAIESDQNCFVGYIVDLSKNI